MKKCFVFLALLGLLSTAHAADFGISVNSPYVATQWDCGKELNIQWSKWGDWSKLNQDPGNQKVQILLRKNAPPRVHVVPLLIADNVPATGVNGKYLWRISGVANGEYHVIVRTINKLYKNESDVFTIKNCLSLPIQKKL